MHQPACRSEADENVHGTTSRLLRRETEKPGKPEPCGNEENTPGGTGTHSQTAKTLVRSPTQTPHVKRRIAKRMRSCFLSF
ncbi:hypothetical protein GN956_G20011 [Arapaima gigas]